MTHAGMPPTTNFVSFGNIPKSKRGSEAARLGGRKPVVVCTIGVAKMGRSKIITCKLFAALSAMPMLLSLNAAALAQATAPAPKTIEVTGHGDSSARPDLMTLSFAVTSHSDSADECTRNESEISRRVIDALKATLGDSAKVSTSDFSFNPSVEYGNATPTPTVMRAAEPPAAWEFKADVNVFTDTLEPIGDLIETGLAAGATSVGQSGISQMPDEQDATPPAFASSTASTTAKGSGGPAYRRFRRMFYVSLSVESQGTSPPDSVRKGAALVGRVEAALRKQIGAQGKVEVTDFNVNEINPEQRPGIPQYRPLPPPQPQRKVYDAQMTVSAETPKLELLGSLVEAAMKAGATRLNQVSFTLKDDSDARREAIEKASADAKSKAETLASSMGVKLKGILRISTNAQARPYVVYGNQYMGAPSLARMSRAEVSSQPAPMPVTPREVGFSADVNVTYQIE